MANDVNRFGMTYDAGLLLKDAGLVAVSGPATVGGAPALIDVGDGAFLGMTALDISSIETYSSNELYTFIMQGAQRDPTSTRDVPVPLSGSWENLAELDLGFTSVRKGGAKTSTAGRYLLPFRNVQNDQTYQILRLYIVTQGSIALGVNLEAWIGKMAY